eukprot:scaffold287_cov151-Skeletonema_marinoi.AAC.4
MSPSSICADVTVRYAYCREITNWASVRECMSKVIQGAVNATPTYLYPTQQTNLLQISEEKACHFILSPHHFTITPLLSSIWLTLPAQKNQPLPVNDMYVEREWVPR